MTIYDVAQLAGVSAATVSRVVNGKRVDPEMTDRVLKAVQATEFRPNQLARGLLLQRSKMIGCILPDISNPFFATLFMAIERQALEFGYTLLLSNTLNNLDLETQQLHIMSERQVDAIILMGGRINEVTLSEELLAGTQAILQRTPLIMVNGDLPGVEAASVQVNEVQGIREATRHLLDLGHTQIAFLGGLPNVRATRQKRAVFLEELKRAGAGPGLALDSDYTLQSGAEMMRSVLARPRAEWPTAVLGVNDVVAVGAAHVAVGAGLSIPRDLSVVGFDDTALSATFSPALTSVSHRYETLAQVTLEVTFQALQGTISTRTLEPELIVRGSSGPRPKRAKTDR